MMDLKDLIKAGVHFGHQKTRWCPKMAPYIWGYKNDVHLIDVSKTAVQLEKASKFLHDIAAEGKSILWVGTKKSARDSIVRIGTSLNMPYVYHRWIGGTLSNNGQVKKSVTKLLHYEDVIAKSEKFPLYTKKEFTIFQKLVDRLKKNVGGIRSLSWPLGAIVLVDVTKERSALKEATIMGVPVVALVDTNSDPSNVDIVIPANDDAPRAINLLLDYLAESTRKGMALAVQKPKNRDAAVENQQQERDMLLASVEGGDEEEDNRSTRGATRNAKKKADDEAAALEAAARMAMTKRVVPAKKEDNSEDRIESVTSPKAKESSKSKEVVKAEPAKKNEDQ